jgi:uncharacterized protein GlcG (DUF336 family)
LSIDWAAIDNGPVRSGPLSVAAWKDRDGALRTKNARARFNFTEKPMNILKSAITLAGLAEEEAVSAGLKLTFCVIDLHGNVVLKHRMDEAILISVEMAERKAFTVAALHIKTSDISAGSAPGQPFSLLASAAGDRYWIDGGGVPFHVGGQFVGGFGVSGGSISEDVAIAEAAMKAFEKS